MHIVGSFEFFDITVCNGTANNVRLKNYGNNSVIVKYVFHLNEYVLQGKTISLICPSNKFPGRWVATIKIMSGYRTSHLYCWGSCSHCCLFLYHSGPCWFLFYRYTSCDSCCSICCRSCRCCDWSSSWHFDCYNSCWCWFYEC